MKHVKANRPIISGQLTAQMLRAFHQWAKEQGLDSKSKITLDEWKKTEDYKQLYIILFEDVIPVLDDDDDIDYPDLDDHVHSSLF